MNSKDSFEFDFSAIHNLTCEIGNETHAHYWHVAFNESGELVYSKPLVKNALCKANRPHAQTIFSIQCMTPNGEAECLLGHLPLMYSFEGRKSNTTIHKILQ